jgi:hypothetical protein
MPALVVNRQEIAGELVGQPTRGREPLPWMLVTVRSSTRVWDRFGNIVHVPFEERVVVQGSINIKKLHPRMLPGLSVFAAGQRVFADKVGPDVPGTVMLADVFNIIEGHHDATKD